MKIDFDVSFYRAVEKNYRIDVTPYTEAPEYLIDQLHNDLDMDRSVIDNYEDRVKVIDSIEDLPDDEMLIRAFEEGLIDEAVFSEVYIDSIEDMRLFTEAAKNMSYDCFQTWIYARFNDGEYLPKNDILEY